MRARVVGAGEWAVDSGDAVLAVDALGSCVAVALYDPERRVGGLIHILLPSPSLARDHSNPARFAETGIPLLLSEVMTAGAQRGSLTARLVGGASMFGRPGGPAAMGDRNVAAARQALARTYIPVVAQEVLGYHGRSASFHLQDGRIEVRSVAHGTIVL